MYLSGLMTARDLAFCLLLSLFLTLPAPSHGQSTATPTAVGAEAYYQWMGGCLDGLEKDLPSITASADAAARLYLRDGWEIGAIGDNYIPGEFVGRSGGMMRIANPGKIFSPEWKGIVLLFPRETSLARDLAQAGELKKQGKMVLLFGRLAVARQAESAGVECDAFINTHAAVHGGLFQAADGNWVVPTDQAADIAAMWTWTGEFVGALTRLGKMPPMYMGYAVPGGKQRAEKILARNIKFHDEKPRKVGPGVIGGEFLKCLRADLSKLHEELPNIRKVADQAIQTAKAGHHVYTFAHGHAILSSVGLPHDPGYFRQINGGWFDLKKNIKLQPGDFVYCVGFDTVYTGGSFGNRTREMRDAGARLAWSITDYNKDNVGVSAIGKDETLVNQRWAAGDAVATIPGYDIKILPTSGVLAEATLWMVEADVFDMLGGKPYP